LRFFGRRVYFSAIVILAVDFCKQLGLAGLMARQTLARWKAFWRESLSSNHVFFRWAKGFLPPEAQLKESPASVLSIFDFPEPESRIPILQFFIQAS
jgi:hypothetical protein